MDPDPTAELSGLEEGAVATSVAGRSLATRRVWVRRPISLFSCLLVVLGLAAAGSAALSLATG